MEFNLILAGVGGQGILTIAQAIGHAAVRRGYRVKQSEVHGMSQRGGAVQSHLRFADHDLHSDMVPLGKADLVLAVEPLEALRYVEYLHERGVIVSNSVPFVNIPNYPPVEETLLRICKHGDHVVIDASRLARAAGSARAENMVMLGAAASCMDFQSEEFETIIAEAFARKGEKVVDVNRRAFRLGRDAARAYRGGLRRGGTCRAVRQWIATIPPEQLAGAECADGAVLGLDDSCALTNAETHAIAQLLERVQADQRRRLYEHEVYCLVELVGAISPPRHRFVARGETVTAEHLERFPGDRVVLKVVSPDIVHKTEAGGVVFVPKTADAVNREIEQLIRQQCGTGFQPVNHRLQTCATPNGERSRRVEGALVVEFVENARRGFGSELFVGVRATREFGPVIAAGLGGVDTEYLAASLKPGIAVAKALALDTSPEAFFELFTRTAAYEVLSGSVRGHERVVSDGELVRCFRAFIAVARRFCFASEDGMGLRELEVNPFAFSHQRMLPLDGRGSVGTLIEAAPPRPTENVRRMIEPESIAVVGVSAKRPNFGRIILNNIKDCGFPREHLYVVKDDAEAIDGVRCVPSVADLPAPVDLLVAATAANMVPKVVDEVVASGRAKSVILIPGGLGEKEGTEEVQATLRDAISRARRDSDRCPVLLGGNCMGMRSRPGRYDTFFIPDTRLDPRRTAPPKRVAVISQSGAFIITRMSNLECLDPTLAISVGNQVDLTVADMLRAVGARGDVDCVGVYAEGFNDLDGMDFVRAVADATASGKVVVFYKAGRTASGRAATMGHTAAVAGDYDVCQAAVANAGAIVTDTFREFEQLLELATELHGKTVRGRRIVAVSNAGFETVGMADNLVGTRYRLAMPDLADDTRERLAACLARHQLDTLVNARNPLDMTPMATDEAYEDCIRVLMEADEIDAVAASCVPLTPRMLTTPDEIGQPGSIANRLPRILRDYDKPLIFIVDSADPYDALASAVRAGGVPVFRSADQAIRSLGRYLCHRATPASTDAPQRNPVTSTPTRDPARINR